MPSIRYRLSACVLPGVLLTLAMVVPAIRLIRDDFPTLDLPRNATFGSLRTGKTEPVTKLPRKEALMAKPTEAAQSPSWVACEAESQFPRVFDAFLLPSV